MAWIDPGTAVDSAMSSVAAAGLLSYIIEALKKSRLVPWVTADKTTLLRWLNAVSALAMSVGLNWAYHADAHQLVITVPTLAAVVDGAWNWGKQWAFQQMAYDGIVSRGADKSDT